MRDPALVFLCIEWFESVKVTAQRINQLTQVLNSCFHRSERERAKFKDFFIPSIHGYGCIKPHLIYRTDTKKNTRIALGLVKSGWNFYQPSQPRQNHLPRHHRFFRFSLNWMTISSYVYELFLRRSQETRKGRNKRSLHQAMDHCQLVYLQAHQCLHQGYHLGLRLAISATWYRSSRPSIADFQVLFGVCGVWVFKTKTNSWNHLCPKSSMWRAVKVITSGLHAWLTE